MDQYMSTDEDVMMAWAITYLIKGFESIYTIDCSNIEQEAADWFDSLGGLGGLAA